MKNLRYAGLQEAHSDDKLPFTATAWDPATDTIICTFGPTPDHAVISLKRKTSGAASKDNRKAAFSLIATWDAPCPSPDLPCDAVICLQYFPDTSSICIVLSGGDIVLVREEPSLSEEKIEIIGSVDGGITAGAWAPDEELLALTTRSGTLLYMSRNFDNVVSVSFSFEDLKASNHVSVGWGKKETQFKGKRAKLLRDPTMPETVDEGKIEANDDGRVTISWRGDGSYVAVNSVESEIRRVIRVYSRDGTLDSISEPVDGLTGALSWRPAGNLIAGIQRLADRVDVVFFERNGLRHGQFSLRLAEEDMRTWASEAELHWNINSSVLAVCFRDRVQMWTVGNHHYYLKQEIPLPVARSVGATLLCRWHSEKQLFVSITSDHRLLDIQFVSEVTRGSTIHPNDFGAVAVIDGKVLKLTLFKFAVIPPPLALVELTLEDNIIDVAFSPSGRRIAVLINKMILLYAWDPKVRSLPVEIFRQPLRLHNTFPNSTTGRPSTCSFEIARPSRGWQGGDPDAAFRILPSGYVDRYHGPNGFSDVFGTTVSPDLRRRIVVLGRSGIPQTHNLFCVMMKPETDENGEGSFGDSNVFAENTLQLDYHEGGTLTASKPVVDEEGEHLCTTGDKVLGTNVNSYIITGDYLIFTTTKNLLKFVHLTKLEGKPPFAVRARIRLTGFADLDVPQDTPETDERCRNIESGATIVTACPTDYKVILQMPRGNIETIYPRALVVSAIRRFLDHAQYKAAFEACRKHGVDYNILHDYDALKFKSNVAMFVSQLKGANINEFLIKLDNDDVSQTLYRDTLLVQRRAVLPPSTLHRSKVNQICNALIDILQIEPEKYCGNLVTAYASKDPPDIEAALKFVQQVTRNTSSNMATVKDEAISRICFLVDKKDLYNTAIGLYDLDLAVVLAQEAQMDPKEYLPWVQRLKKEPESHRYFLIDDSLKRTEKALGWLFKLGSHDEALKYTEKHGLYQASLEHYKYMQEELKKIEVLYAQYLFKNSMFKDAAVSFESVQHYSNASDAYAKAHMWRESLNCAAIDPLSNAENLRDLASSLAQVIAGAGDFGSAATIHAEYLADVPQAVKYLCQAYRFADATGVLISKDLYRVNGDLVNNGLAEAMSSMTELLADCKAQLLEQIPRLRKARAKKDTDPVAYYDLAGKANADGVDIPDDVSLAPTDASTAGASLFTRYTNVSNRSSSSRNTSQNRRREERKRAQGKPGTIYEKEYLVNSIARLIERVNSVNENVGRLVEGLASHGKREEAKAVRKAMHEVVTMCRGCVEEVFQPDNAPGDHSLRPGGADGVLFDSGEEQRRPKVTPTVKVFEEFAFLGK